MSFYSEFAGYYEAVFPYRDLVNEFLASHLQGPPQRVLDLGCGTGHYCGRLAAAGHRVLGIDLDPAMIAVARREYPAAGFRRLDLNDVHTLAGPFDLAFCIGNVAAHLPGANLPRFLSRLEKILAPGGRWIFQVVNWDFILDQAKPQGSYRFDDRQLENEGVIFRREYRDVSPESLRFLTSLEGPEGTIFAGEVVLYPVRAGRYLQLHEQAGFTLAGHYSDYLRTPFDPAANAAAIYVFQFDG